MLDIPFHYLVESFAKIKKEFSRNSHGKNFYRNFYRDGYEKFPGGRKQAAQEYPKSAATALSLLDLLAKKPEKLI